MMTDRKQGKMKMNGYKFQAMITILLLVMAACSPIGALNLEATSTQAPTTVPTVTKPVMTPTATLKAMSAQRLKNMPYFLPVSGKTVILSDGAYQGGAGADYVLANLGEALAFGDLNNDGREDSAVIIAENMGGSGVFISLVVVYNEDEVLLQGPDSLLGDRIQINSVAIQSGRILVNLVRHGPNDPFCCPTQPARQHYTVTQSGLRMTHMVAVTPSGDEIEISIEQPQDGEMVPAMLQVLGSVTISPFENTLVYQVQNDRGDVLLEGPVMVQSEDIGEPGTFQTIVDLSNVQAELDLWLVVSDVSMANGSTVAMDTVKLRRE